MHVHNIYIYIYIYLLRPKGPDLWNILELPINTKVPMPPARRDPLHVCIYIYIYMYTYIYIYKLRGFSEVPPTLGETHRAVNSCDPNSEYAQSTSESFPTKSP